ncbi:MAG: hypothetical protein KZQ75_05350 [Candidatus Thiodiazotropha sp. (ex Myrtea spinifera)]|nr:hypothetical protein [Candidatus Thiodiazotropha sp. (ex Myrtea spinifera)]
MIKIISLIAILAMCSVTNVIAQTYSQDTGTIKRLYASQSGAVAILLDGGFINGNADGQCPTNKGWAGNHAPDPFMKSVLLAAKTSRQKVTVTLQGCAPGGGWFKITDVYLND